MKKQIKLSIALILIGIIVLVGVIAFFYFKEKPIINEEENQTNNFIIYNKVGMANPSSNYCPALGYKERFSEQRGFCIFPDGTECEEWAFYRGKCGQEWSYCELIGYDLKNLTIDEGWGIDGSICINKTTKEEVGNVFELVNQEFIRQNSIKS